MFFNKELTVSKEMTDVSLFWRHLRNLRMKIFNNFNNSSDYFLRDPLENHEIELAKFL